jgi:hypothetical protein
MNKYILVNPRVRQSAIEAVRAAPEGYVVEVKQRLKSRDAEMKYHAMIGDIARAVPIFDRLWDREDMKRLLVDQFVRDMKNSGTPLRHGGQVVPSIDGTGIVQLGVQTRDFLKAEASAFIEYLFAFGAEHDVRWSETAGHGWEELARGFV